MCCDRGSNKLEEQKEGILSLRSSPLKLNLPFLWHPGGQMGWTSPEDSPPHFSRGSTTYPHMVAQGTHLPGDGGDSGLFPVSVV